MAGKKGKEDELQPIIVKKIKKAAAATMAARGKWPMPTS